MLWDHNIIHYESLSQLVEVINSRNQFIPGRVSIDQRPAIVDTRECFGDWEGGTMEGARTLAVSLPMSNAKAVILWPRN
jgi:IS30 family transposase